LEYLNIPAAEKTTNKWLRLHENFAKIKKKQPDFQVSPAGNRGCQQGGCIL
jgi:hypothetical protein